MVDLRLVDLRKDYGSLTAIKGMTMTLESGTVTCLLGPSGCGKTTLLRLIAGLETPTSGQIYFGDREVSHLPPRKRNISMVFQYPVMYPTLSVAENLELPLKEDRTLSAADRRKRVDQVLEMLQLSGHANALIGELDNGRRQKVAVGRAVARQTDLILFDEPTTNVEINAKLELIRAFKIVSQELNQTTIYVTHDQTEAMTLADQIALMNAGRVLQCEAPRTMYSDPNNAFGGWFLGNPGMNFVTVPVDGRGVVETPLLPGPATLDPAPQAKSVTIGIRPEHVQVSPDPHERGVACTVKHKAITIGGQYLVTMALGDLTVKAKVTRQLGRALGERAWAICPLEHIQVFDTEGDRIRGELGQPVPA